MNDEKQVGACDENTREHFEQSVVALNLVLVDILKKQGNNFKKFYRAYIATVICFTLVIIAMVIAFFWYEVNYPMQTVVETQTTTTTTQEVDGQGTINNVDGNQNNFHDESQQHNYGGE